MRIFVGYTTGLHIDDYRWVDRMEQNRIELEQNRLKNEVSFTKLRIEPSSRPVWDR